MVPEPAFAGSPAGGYFRIHLCSTAYAFISITLKPCTTRQWLKSRPYGHIPSSTRLTLVKKPPKVLFRGSTRFTVKARNGNDVTRREAHAVGPGDSMARVKTVFGTSGSTEIKGSNGIQVRSYDGWVVIGFLNGRVNTIQYL